MPQEWRRRWQPRHNKDNVLLEACDREMQDGLHGGPRLVLNFDISRGAVRYQKQGETRARNSTISTNLSVQFSSYFVSVLP